MFCIDERIQSTCFTLGDWPLSRVLLKNEKNYPWLILVPRKVGIQEIFQLESDERFILMEEIHQLSLVVHRYFKTDKLNIGALGNIVSQLHIHVVGRNKNDILWPQGIWQASFDASAYEKNILDVHLSELTPLVNAIKFNNAK